MKKKQLVKIYEEAARRVDENWHAYSCVEVSQATELLTGRDIWGESAPDALYFRTMQINEGAFWNEFEISKRKLPRVLALLLMAEWVKTDYVES